MWKTIDYAATGKRHLREGMPCQDKVIRYRVGDVSLAALADGAGSASLSHYGAEAVLYWISRDIGDHFDEFYEEEAGGVIRQRIIYDIVEALDETQKEYQCSLRDLSSTLLVVAVSGDRYLIVHIGDGVIGYLKNDEIRVATVPDNGDYANETVFTTSASAISRMRLIKGEDAEIGGFVLMSDGTEKALYDKRTGRLSQGIRRIMQMTTLCPSGPIRGLLEESFQDGIMQLTQDDCSISILVDTKAFPDYFHMSLTDRMDCLQMGSDARHKTKRIRRTGEILKAAEKGASAENLARLLHIKPRHINKKLNTLVELGLLEKRRGIYYSAAYEDTILQNRDSYAG